MEPRNKSLNFIFPTKYVYNPKKFKVLPLAKKVGGFFWRSLFELGILVILVEWNIGKMMGKRENDVFFQVVYVWWKANSFTKWYQKLAKKNREKP